MSHDPLFSAALLGTARLTSLPPAPDALLEESWKDIPAENPVAAVLQALALTRALRRAGTRSLEAPAAADPCPPEPRDELSTASIDALMRLLKGEFPEVLPEWLRLALASGRVVPPRALPELLAAAKRDRSLRPAVRGIAGERGLWIARRHAAFAWLLEEAAVDDAAWEDGQPAERLAWLRQTRAADPERAIAAITAHWPGEEGTMRESILRVIAESPLPGDEPWLEELALKDRRQEARELAAAALLQIDGSAFRRRALERLRGQVKIVKKTITLDPPAAYDPAWAADGIKEKPPQGTGEKAWWLRQIIALVSLDDWPGLLEISESDLFILSRDPDWQEPLLLGWIDSARRLPARSLPGHLLPFLATREPWPNTALPKHLVLSSVLNAMPPAAAVAALDAIAKHLPPLIALDLFARIGRPPPPGTGKALLALLDQTLATHPSPLARPQARSLAICIPHDAIQSRLEAIAQLSELSPAAEEFATTLEFRRSLLPHFEPSKSP
jgi:hypothetical protein